MRIKRFDNTVFNEYVFLETTFKIIYLSQYMFMLNQKVFGRILLTASVKGSQAPGRTKPLRLLDQRWWAARVTELGCGSKPVKVQMPSLREVSSSMDVFFV